MREMPSDQTSDLIVYGAPWIRSGYDGQYTRARPGQTTHAHVRAGAHKRVGDRVDKFTRHPEIADLDLPSGIREDVRRFDI